MFHVRPTYPLWRHQVIKWKHFPRYWPFVQGIHRSPLFFDLRLNKQLNKQSWSWWFETLSRSLWRHCNVLQHLDCKLINRLWNGPQIANNDFLIGNQQRRLILIPHLKVKRVGVKNSLYIALNKANDLGYHYWVLNSVNYHLVTSQQSISGSDVSKFYVLVTDLKVTWKHDWAPVQSSPGQHTSLWQAVGLHQVRGVCSSEAIPLEILNLISQFRHIV